MKRNTVYFVLLFTILWIIMTESLSPWSILAGFAFSVLCVIFCYKMLPFEKIADINLWRLFLYSIYLIGQLYLAGLSAIRLVILGAKADIVEINTEIENDFLRVVLANSITITPGTLTLELQDDELTVLWLRKKTSGGYEDHEDPDETIKGGLERMLRKAQK